MIRLRVQCPRCKKQRDWMTYYASSIQELVAKNRQTTCFYCHKGFVIKGMEHDRIVKVLEIDKTNTKIHRMTGLD